MGDLKELKRVVMKMHTESINILTEKRAALEAGDDAMVRAMGEGKDIMSILCTYTHFQYIILVMTKVMSNRYSKSKQRKEGRRKVI